MTHTLHARLVAYLPNGARLGALPAPLSWDASIIHNDLGALKVTYSRRAVGGGILQRGLEAGLEIGLEVSDGGAWTEPYNGRFLLTGRSRNAEDTSDTVTLNCQAMGWLTKKILNNDTSHLVQDGDNKGKRAFLSKNPGTIIRTILDENRQRKGAGHVLSAGFDTGRDSGGAAWKSVYTLYYSLGTSLNSMVSSMVGGGAIDWRTDGRQLKIWNAGSTNLSRDLSGRVHVSMSHDVLEAPEEESIEDLASDILVEGDNGLIFRETNPAAPTPWGGWESYVSQGGVSDESTAKAFMQTTLASSARVRGQYTRSLLVTDAESLPLVDYRPGDWITAPTVRHGEKVRVQQVTISLGSDGLKASVTLNDKVYDSQVRQAKKIQGITGGAQLAGSEGGRPAPEKDHRVPQAPAGLVVATDAYIAADGNAWGVATLQWAAVTEATDNTAIDISSYRVEYRKNVAGAPWVSGGVTSSDTLTIGIGGLECGVRYEFRVRAVPTYSDRLGDWSPVVVVLVASDVTPPSVPSTPILTSKLGVVSVRWDGKNNVGAGMEPDFAYCEVGISQSNGNWAYRDRVQGDGYCHVTGLELNSTWWFALRSVDRSGNKSDWSEGASIKVAPAVTQEELNASAADILNKAHADAAAQVAVTDKKVAANTAAIEANKGEQEKADAAIKADVQKNADAITANKAEADKADAAIRTDLQATQDAVRKNTDANTAQQQQITQTQTALSDAQKTITQHTQAIANAQKQADAAKAAADANGKRIDANTAGIGKVQEHQAEIDRTVSQAQSDIKAATSTAQKALDKANTVGTSLDGLHQVFTGPDDPTTLEGVTVKDGDLWNRTAAYWTRWQGGANDSPSLLADFYTSWTGDANGSASLLTTLDTRVIGTYKWDVRVNGWVELTNADMEAVKKSLDDNKKALDKAGADIAQANKDLSGVKTDLSTAQSTLTQAQKDIRSNSDAITTANATLSQAQQDIAANKSNLDKANATLSQAQKDIQSNRDAIVKANGTLSQAQQDIAANKSNLDKANATLSQAQKDIQSNRDAIAKANGDLAAANKTIASNTASIEKNRTDITAASSTAQKALDKANSVGTSLDGLHNIYTGPDDPTTLKGVTVRQGDLWYRTQKYWATWQGEANDSPSLLADFYTYWTGTANNSASALVPLSSRIVDANVYDGNQWNQINLVAANILATGSVVTSNLSANAVTADKIAANAVTSDKIIANAITAAKLSANSVTSDKITSNAITADKLAANSVDASKIVGGTISGDKIAGNTITAGNFAAGSVTADKIAVNAVTADKINAGAITSDKIVSNAITGDKIAANSIDASKIKAGSITSALIAVGAITADKVAANSINGDKLTANAVTSDKITANAVTAWKIAAGAVTADKIAVNSVTGDKIVGNSITGDKIAAGSINASHLTANAVTADALAANSVTADKVKAGAITADKIAAGSITADKIKGNLLSGTTVEGGTFRTLNGRLVINDTGVKLSDSKGGTTLSALTADGSVTMRGALTSGSTITGTTITGSQFTTTGRHVDISDDGMLFTDADGNPVLTWAPIGYATRWQGEPNDSPSRLTTLDDRWRLAMDAPIMSSATISGSTVKGGVIEGAEYRGVKPDGTRYLTINSSGMTVGDKLAYDSGKGQLTLTGTIKASTITGSTITTTNGRLTINDSGIVLRKGDGTGTLTASASDGSVTMIGTVKASTITGSTVTTTNGRMLWNDSGLVLKDASGSPTLTMLTSDGSIALKGSITSGSTLSGVTVTGSTIQTSAEEKRGVKLTSGGLVGYGADGNAKFTLDTNGNMNTDGGVIANGTLTAVNMQAGTINGTVITGANVNGSTVTGGIVQSTRDGSRITFTQTDRNTADLSMYNTSGARYAYVRGRSTSVADSRLSIYSDVDLDIGARNLFCNGVPADGAYVRCSIDIPSSYKPDNFHPSEHGTVPMRIDYMEAQGWFDTAPGPDGLTQVRVKYGGWYLYSATVNFKFDPTWPNLDSIPMWVERQSNPQLGLAPMGLQLEPAVKGTWFTQTIPTGMAWLQAGDVIYLKFGTDENHRWKLFTGSNNRLSLMKLPFGNIYHGGTWNTTAADGESLESMGGYQPAFDDQPSNEQPSTLALTQRQEEHS